MTAKLKGDIANVFDVKKPALPITPKEGKGISKMTFHLSTPAKKQLAILAAEEEKSQRQLFVEALNLLFREYKKPEIA